MPATGSPAWDRREALAEKRIVIAWGMKDIAFRAKEMRRWQEAFPSARSVQFPDCGHYVAEEQPVEAGAGDLAALDVPGRLACFTRAGDGIVGWRCQPPPDSKSPTLMPKAPTRGPSSRVRVTGIKQDRATWTGAVDWAR